MANFKYGLFIGLSLVLTGCQDDSPSSFFNNLALNTEQKIEYQDIHRLSLVLSDLEKKIDESGFSPTLKCQFQLKDTLNGMWQQAWIAFRVSIVIAKKEIASIKRAGVMEGHTMEIQFQHELPKFGYKPSDIEIIVHPIAWMPSFPLTITSDDNATKQSSL